MKSPWETENLIDKLNLIILKNRYVLDKVNEWVEPFISIDANGRVLLWPPGLASLNNPTTIRAHVNTLSLSEWALTNEMATCMPHTLTLDKWSPKLMAEPRSPRPATTTTTAFILFFIRQENVKHGNNSRTLNLAYTHIDKTQLKYQWRLWYDHGPSKLKPLIKLPNRDGRFEQNSQGDLSPLNRSLR